MAEVMSGVRFKVPVSEARRIFNELREIEKRQGGEYGFDAFETKAAFDLLANNGIVFSNHFDMYYFVRRLSSTLQYAGPNDREKICDESSLTYVKRDDPLCQRALCVTFENSIVFELPPLTDSSKPDVLLAPDITLARKIVEVADAQTGKKLFCPVAE